MRNKDDESGTRQDWLLLMSNCNAELGSEVGMSAAMWYF